MKPRTIFARDWFELSYLTRLNGKAEPVMFGFSVEILRGTLPLASG